MPQGLSKVGPAAAITVATQSLSNEVGPVRTSTIEQGLSDGRRTGPDSGSLLEQWLFGFTTTAGHMAGQRELSDGALISPVPGRDSTWEQAHTCEHLRDVHKGALAGQAVPQVPVLAEIKFRAIASYSLIGTAAEHH